MEVVLQEDFPDEGCTFDGQTYTDENELINAIGQTIDTDNTPGTTTAETVETMPKTDTTQLSSDMATEFGKNQF